MGNKVIAPLFVAINFACGGLSQPAPAENELEVSETPEESPPEFACQMDETLPPIFVDGYTMTLQRALAEHEYGQRILLGSGEHGVSFWNPWWDIGVLDEGDELEVGDCAFIEGDIAGSVIRIVADEEDRNQAVPLVSVFSTNVSLANLALETANGSGIIFNTESLFLSNVEVLSAVTFTGDGVVEDSFFNGGSYGRVTIAAGSRMRFDRSEFLIDSQSGTIVIEEGASSSFVGGRNFFDNQSGYVTEDCQLAGSRRPTIDYQATNDLGLCQNAFEAMFRFGCDPVGTQVEVSQNQENISTIIDGHDQTGRGFVNYICE